MQLLKLSIVTCTILSFYSPVDARQNIIKGNIRAVNEFWDRSYDGESESLSKNETSIIESTVSKKREIEEKGDKKTIGVGPVIAVPPDPRPWGSAKSLLSYSWNQRA